MQEMEYALHVCAKYGFKLNFLLLLDVFALALAWIWVSSSLLCVSKSFSQTLR